MREPRSNFFYLLAGLLILLLLAPLASGRFDRAVNFAFTGTLVVGVWSLARTRWAYLLGLTLAGLSVVTGGIEYGVGDARLFILTRSVAFAFCLLSVGIILREVLYTRTVDANRVAGAVCIYLLLGLNWGFVYSFLYATDPSSFAGVSDDVTVVFLNLLYFSFVTLTTLGYGDISPISPFARALAYLQAVTGVMYTAILVASLIGGFTRPPQGQNDGG